MDRRSSAIIRSQTAVAASQAQSAGDTTCSLDPSFRDSLPNYSRGADNLRSMDMVAKAEPQLFGAMLDHGLTAAAAPPDLITSDARDLILRVSRGIPRLISHLLRISLVLADERGLSSIDVSVVNSAAIVLHLESTRPAVPPSKPRFDLDSRSRG